jgi:hypothetical protein
MVDTAGAEKKDRCRQEDRSTDYAGRRCGKGYQHDARHEREGSHPSMQPTTKPRLDCLKHVGQ